jgi:two-component system NtrC family response regulator
MGRMNDEKVNILVVDDDKEFVVESKEMLQPLGDVHFEEGYSEADFYSLYKPGKYNAIILDLRLESGYEGMGLLEYALNEDPGAPIIVLTGYASIETAIKSLKLGAKDYLEKQYLKEPQFKKEFLKKVNRIIIEDKARKMANQMTVGASEAEQIIGNDIKIKRIVKFADKFAESKESPILLVGEIGTEKEQVARYIHSKSSAKGQFIAKTIHLDEKNMDRILFGDDKTPGLIKDAQAGVLYLEDIFNLDFETQGRLLEYIDTGVLKKEGKKHGQNVKVQLIFSTTGSSEQLLKNKNIYSNFYYRVKTPEILIPPLRERGGDIIMLTRFYLEELKNNGKTTAESVSEEVLEMFDAYPWPGNLFELKNVVELSGMNARLDNDKVIKTGHLPGALQQNAMDIPDSAQINLEKILAETTLKYMENALKKSNGAKIEAYKYLGYPESKRGTLNARFQKFFTTYPDLASRFPGIYKLYMEK